MSEITSSPAPRDQSSFDAAMAGAGLSVAVGRSERRAVLLIILAIFMLNVLTASRSPTVWKDEVMFIDPAVNWVTGNGFVSTAWSGQSSRTIWASNAPLHTILLCPWFKLFGVSPTSARAINFVYVSAAAYLLWLAAARARWLKTSRSRVFLVLLVLLANGVSFAYRSGRYDALGMLLVSAVCFFATVRNRRTRLVALTLAGVLVPWTGLHLIGFMGIMGVVLLGCMGRKTLRITGPLGVGVVIGGALFVGSLHLIGAWQDFSRYAMGMQATPAFGGPGSSYLHRSYWMIYDIMQRRDFSLMLMFVLLVATPVFRKGLPKRLVLLGYAISGAVPVGIAMVYVFAAYYTWMAYVPLTIVVLAMWERGSPRFGAGIVGLGHSAFLCAVMVVGWPARMGLMVREWSWRDHGRVVEFAQANVRPTDIAFISPSAYYPVKQIAKQVYVQLYIDQMTPEEIGSLTVLVMEEDEVSTLPVALTSQFKQVAAMPPPPSPGRVHFRHLYGLVVLRREVPATTNAGR